ncbi:eukaryotic translation initiation factor 4G isoform X1 [Lucilia cuprina]|uniref:eukaryotic translation initiation factor 4G isoform X1 n=2 Tax=Lucilia cuprina TaxID=7375 RepID=UPI001F066D2F|nr:eukaryotic translation initiation factor 4G isoform X1 [Lucilia cuprina]
MIRQQLPDSEKLTSQDQPSLSDQHILYTPVFYISGNGGYVAAPSAGYTLPQQSGLQQPTVSAAASGSAVPPQPALQLLHGIQPTVTSGQQTDLYKMQPQSAQNIIITSNKKKKYTSNAQTASLATKQQHQQQVALLQSVNKQQQYHINKGYNVVSISMSSNTINTAAVTGSGGGQQQLQPQQHSYHLQHHQGHVTQHHQPHQPSIVNCKINQNFITRGANMSLSSAAAVAPSTGNGSVICTTNAVLTLHHNGQHSCPEPLNSQTIFNMSTHRAVGATALNTSLPSLVSSANGNNQIDTNSSGLLVGNGAEIVLNDNSHNVGSLQGTTNMYGCSTPTTSDGSLITLSSTMHAAGANTMPISLGGNSAVNVPPSINSSLTAACGSNSTSYITSTTIHDKINIGCSDSRKYDYDYKTNKFNTAATTINSSTTLNNNYQMHAEYVPQSAANNSPGRSNQPTAGNIYRQNPSSPAPRNRYVHSATMYPAVHQSVVLGQFTAPYATRTPQLQQCQYSPQYYPPMYYPYYLQQPPQQQRTTVNPAVGVGLSSAMTVQPGGSVSGPTAPGNQGQIPLGVAPVAANTVLSVANTSAAQPVGVAPLVGMPHQPPPQQQQQNQPQTKGKLRSHALQIIHPVTNRNILDDLDIDKNESPTVVAGGQLTSSTSVANIDTSIDTEIGSLTTSSTSIKSAVKISETSKSHTEVVQQMETSPVHQSTTERNFKETTQKQQQTPIVSAMTDAPSVEILPTQPQKQKTKKSQNVTGMKQDQNSSQGKTEENIKQVSDVSTTSTTANSNCVQESLPTNYINQQVPQQEQLKDKHQEEKNSASLKTAGDINTTSKQKDESKESCTGDYFGASEQDKSTIYNITESVKTMQLGEKETLTLPQQNQINIVNSNDQQEQEQQETQYSNATNGNNVTTATTLTEIVNNNIVNSDVVNNNNNQNSNNVNNENVFSTNKNTDKIVKKIDNVTEKNKTVSPKVEATATDTGNTASKNTATSKDESHDETDRANVLTKNDLESKQKNEQVSTPTNDNTSTKSPKNEKAEPGNDNISKESTDDKEQSSSESKAIDEAAANNKQSFESLINYNEGQWSPSNPSGKKQYNREQLMQLREAKASRIQPEVKNTSIFSQTNLMPAFASRGNKKVQSMVGGFGGARGSSSGDGNYQNNYMKQSSMSGRGGADGHHNRNSGKPIIHLNLSLNQDVKLNEADNAWRPSVLVQGAEKQVDPETKAQREKDELIRRVRGILNKLTPEKFEPLVEEIIKLKIDTMEKMEAVMILVFEKAIDEPNFSVSYASLCHRLINEVKARDERMESGTKSNLAYFRNALLDKTEREFTQNVTKSSAKEEKLKPIREKINNCKDPNEKVELEALLDEEERKIRRRSGGTVRFIGELFKISILTGKIIHTCIEALLKDPNNEDMLECLCKLLTTVGQKFEQTNMPKEDKRKYSLESVIQRMQNIASKNENSKISSRVRFMLQDVIDLRKKKWQSTRNEAPKTMEQIEKEANSEQLSNPYHYMNSMPSGGDSRKRDGGGRNDGRSSNYSGSHSQRGDTGSLKRQQGGVGGGSHSQSGNLNNDDTWHVQTGKGNRTLAVDSSKLVGLTTVDMNNKKMGGVSLFLWPKTSSQPTTTPSNSFAALSMDSNRSSDRDRERSGPRNKGSYNKGSMERDRYDHGRLLSRNNSTQASRENSSSRSTQGVRGMGGGNSSNMQKSASHSKYQQPMSSSSSSRMTSTKMSGMSAGSGGTSSSSIYRDNQQQSSYYGSNATHQQQHFNPAASESTQPSSAPPAVFEEPTEADLKLIKAVVIEMVENAANSKCIDITTVSCIKKIKENQRCGLLYYILTDYLHLAEVRPICRRHLANVVAYLIENKYISVEHFRLAYKQFAEFASDLMVDIPDLWLYIFEFTGPLIVKKLITVNDLWSSQLRESGSSSFSIKFLKTFIQYCTREVGPSFTRNMWKKNQIKWTDFMNENEVSKFIQTNKFEYVENEKSQPEIDNKEPKEKRNKRVVEHVDQLLKEGSNADNVIDYINGNIVDVDKTFIKSLTTTLTSFAIKDSINYSLDLSCFQKICIPVLLRYLDSKEDLELECLYAIQLLVHSLEHPRGLLGAIFGELNDADVIPQESFIAWRDSKDQSAGKGVAVKALNPFFNQVINGETSDDN